MERKHNDGMPACCAENPRGAPPGFFDSDFVIRFRLLALRRRPSPFKGYGYVALQQAGRA